MAGSPNHRGGEQWRNISSSYATTNITPMEKYVAENAKLDVVDVMPLMRILLVDM